MSFSEISAGFSLDMESETRLSEEKFSGLSSSPAIPSYSVSIKSGFVFNPSFPIFQVLAT